MAKLDYEQFIKQINIKNNSRQDTIDITYSGKDIASSELIVNSLIESYRSQQAKSEIGNVENIKSKFKQQLDSAEKNAKDIASKLKQLLIKYDRNILESKPGYLANKIAEIESKIVAAKSQIKEIDRKIDGLKIKLGLVPQNINNTGSLEQQKLFSQLQEVETKLITEGSRFSSQSPVIINLQAEKARIEAQIRNSNFANQQYVSVNQNNSSITATTEQLVGYEAEKKSLTTQVASWEIDKARYQKDNAIAPEIKQQYQELLTQDQQAKKQYNNLLSKYQQLEIISEDNITNVKIISPTQVKNSLASWNKEIIVASGIGLGFILSLLTVSVLDGCNSSIKTREEIGELLDSKILGNIPDLRKSDFHISQRSTSIPPERFVLEEPYSVACEAYKIVHDNLQQTRKEQKIQAITITSSNTSEGKSTLVSNLASLTTQLGQKVLIVDANLQNPRQKSIWNIDNNLGLTDILQQEVAFDEIVQAPSLNLNLITAGSLVENSESLWESKEIKDFIKYIRQRYDLIIFDTAAISVNLDALKLGQLTDGMILVSRIGFTNPNQSLETKKLIKESKQDILGLVVNDKFNT